MRDNSKGRGKYLDEITIPYIQIPFDIFNELYVTYSNVPEQSRLLALDAYVYKYFTNDRDRIERLRAIDMMAYMIADNFDQRTFQVQNNARWKAYDSGYGQGIDTNEVLQNKAQERKDKKKELNKKAYQKKKLEHWETLDKEEKERLEELIRKSESS